MCEHSRVLKPIRCPACNQTHIVKHAKSAEGKQRSRCQNAACSQPNFVLDYTYRAYLPEVKQQISEMAIPWQWNLRSPKSAKD